MAKALHAIDYLAADAKHPPRPICVLFGNESFFKRQVLIRLRGVLAGDDEDDFSLTEFEGRTTTLNDVVDELSTIAMFGSSRRVVVVDGADDLVTRYRSELEDYVEHPKSSGVLILDVKSWPANTRLYKRLATEGLQVDCGCPAPALLRRWMAAWAKQAHAVEVSSAAAEMLLEMVGPEPGLLDQEIAKLALIVPRGGRIEPETVRQSVGSWRAKTTWDMLDAALAGDTRDALVQLDRLILAGEHPVAILGQISASLRRFAAATRLVRQAEAEGRRIGVRAALEQAGVKGFVLKKAEGQLRQLGRRRGSQLYQWLLGLDLDLKGASAAPPRLLLERLLVQISAPEAK